jgi:hypothetical protein
MTVSNAVRDTSEARNSQYKSSKKMDMTVDDVIAGLAGKDPVQTRSI